MAFLSSASCDSSKQNTTKHQDLISQELKAFNNKKNLGCNNTKIKCMMFLLVSCAYLYSPIFWPYYAGVSFNAWLTVFCTFCFSY